MNRVLGILILVISISAAWIYMDYQSFLEQPLNIPEPGITLDLKQGTSVRKLAARLQTQRVIKVPLYFRAYARLNKLSARIKAGEYWLISGITPVQLFDQLVEGKVTNYSVTLIEGYNFKEMLAKLAENKAIDHQLTGKNAAEIMALLGKPELSPEGQFLAETYHFPKATPDIALLKRSHVELQKLLQQAWEERDDKLPYKTPYDALIMASIIEKETGQASERRKIAGVFVRRLKKGMLLQTDPTVIYGMGDRYKGNIRKKDLRQDTPYNTYVHKGLPPTPICMPGKAAILAAMHPEDGNELYFVAKGNGEHYFSATLKQHNAAVRKFQLKR